MSGGAQMSDPTTTLHEGPDRGRLPIITMIGAGLSFFLFAGLVWVMFYLNKQFYKPQDVNHERQKQLKELKDAEQATLNSHDKTEVPGRFRIPISKAMHKLIAERNAQNEEKSR